MSIYAARAQAKEALSAPVGAPTPTEAAVLPPVVKAGRRQLLIRTLCALALLLICAVAVGFAPSFFDVNFKKDPAPLPDPLGLAALPRTLPVPSRPGIVFSTPNEIDQKLSDEMLDRLGTHNYLLREYIERGVPNDPTVNINLNYYETGDATPHVPNICWLGSGMSIAKEQFITIPKVPHKDGSFSDVEMTMISFYPRAAGSSTGVTAADNASDERYINVAYVFHVNGTYVANRLQVKRAFWNLSSKYAYHCKIEIDVDHPCTREEATTVVGDYLRAALPDIERVLPDWKTLNRVSADQATAASATVK
jgi:hypothetical protein